jgi:hypothetical protein
MERVIRFELTTSTLARLVFDLKTPENGHKGQDKHQKGRFWGYLKALDGAKFGHWIRGR